MYDPNISIALNVSRARLTVIGFVLTINIFTLGIFLNSREEQFSLKIISDSSVFYVLVASLCVGTVAALLLLSERFDTASDVLARACPVSRAKVLGITCMDALMPRAHGSSVRRSGERCLQLKETFPGYF
jgi:hypothetical protein